VISNYFYPLDSKINVAIGEHVNKKA